MNRQVINAIMEYLKKNSSQLNYKYVLGNLISAEIFSMPTTAWILQRILSPGSTKNYQETKKKDKK